LPTRLWQRVTRGGMMSRDMNDSDSINGPQAGNEASGAVRARLSFVEQGLARPKFHNLDPQRDTVQTAEHDVLIHDASALPDPAHLEEQGFAVSAWPTALERFSNDGDTPLFYAAEIERLIRSLTGAASVWVPPVLLVRSADCSQAERSRAEQPIRMVHSDYAESTFLKHLSSLGAAGKGGRYAAYNIWRSLRPPPQDLPLALCDARTVDPGDAVVAEAVSADGVEEFLLYSYSARQRWYFFPDLRPDDVVVFKAFDTEQGRPGPVPHSAFVDERYHLAIPPRQSVDIRAFAYFPS